MAEPASEADKAEDADAEANQAHARKQKVRGETRRNVIVMHVEKAPRNVTKKIERSGSIWRSSAFIYAFAYRYT